MNRRIVILSIPLLTALAMMSGLWRTAAQEAPYKKRKVEKTETEWKKQLTHTQYLVTRQKATEPAFSGKYANSHAKGVYECVCCGAELFSSQAKFESGTGWPSFFEPINRKRIDLAIDNHLAETRTEVICNDCGAHLGHVFNDGPEPTGLRFCLNSAALKLIPANAPAKKATAKSKATAKDKADGKNADPDATERAKEQEKETQKDKEKPADPEKSPASPKSEVK